MKNDEMSVFAKTITDQKYAHDLKDGQKETWSEIANRVAKNVLKSVNAPKSLIEQCTQYIIDRKFIPGGRYLYASGRPFHQVNNCYAGETEVVTRNGTRTLAELAGTITTLMTSMGQWVNAPIKSFGKQNLMKVTLTRAGTTKTIWATPEHSWRVAKNKTKSGRPTNKIDVLTKNLVKGQKLWSVYGYGMSRTPPSTAGIQHGLVYGDGNLPKDEWGFNTSRLQLCGDKNVQLASYFNGYERYTVCETDLMVAGLPRHYKAAVSLQSDRSYLLGWLEGYFAADGCVSKEGATTLASADIDSLKLAKDVCYLLGIGAYSIRYSDRISNLTEEPSRLYSIALMRQTLTSDFFLVEEHKKRFLANPPKNVECAWTIVSVEQTPRVDEVFCAVVDDTHEFVLADNILTGNCLLMRAEDSREGWADHMHKSAMGLMTGAGIGADYSAIRPEGKLIRKTGGFATGPLAVMQITNELGRGVMQGGSRRCLPEGTLITMGDLSKKKIELIRVGDEVMTRFGPRKVSFTLNQGVQTIVEIETENGVVKSSLKHHWLSANGSRTKTFMLTAENLDLKSKLYYHPIPIPGGKDYDVNRAYLLGYYLGDGCAYVSGRTAEVTFQIAGRFKAHNKPQIDLLCAAVQTFGTTNPIERGGHGDCTELRCRGKELVNTFQQYKKPHESFDIPQEIKEACLEARYAFIAGWFDADGSFNEDSWRLSNTHPETRYALRNFLSNLGFVTTENGIDVRFSSYQRTHFSRTIGKYAFKKCGKRPHRTTSEIPSCVQSIRIVGDLPTYDIEVEDVHEFIADDFVSHNSALWAGLNWAHADVMKFITMKNWIKEVRDMKARDFNFPATMDMTNISVQLDDDFFEAYNDDKNPQHSHAQLVYWAVIERMLKTGEPGFSIDTGKNARETLRNACTEITSADDSDICNLGSINLARIDSLEEMTAVTEVATAFLLAGTVYGDVPYAKVDQVRSKNRRLGLGLMGVHEWLIVRGKKYGQDAELDKYLEIYATSGKLANQWAAKWDLSKPIKTRAIAPTGTIGILAETSTGLEPLFCVAYKRRYLKGGTWNYQYVLDPTAKRLIEAGANPDNVEDAYTLAEDVERRLAFQAHVQKYVDHGISSTINLPAWGTELNNLDTVQKFGKIFMKYLPQLRGLTTYPDGARSGQPLSSVRWATAVKHVGEIFVEAADICDISGKGGTCGS
jgi:ribonucleoside-diphosphate reductase alpha chain